MSILIKGMEMPENCQNCRMNGGLFCYAMPREFAGYTDDDQRPDWCPLVELPKKHGRLIDESIVLEMIRKSMGIKDLSFLYNAEKSVVNEIYHAPTVIEADEDK